MSGTNYNNTQHTSSTGGGLGGKVRGAFETIHGVSDSIRAQGMSALDNALGTIQKDQEHAWLAEQGRLEAQTGMARLRGRNPATGVGHSIGAEPQTMNQPVYSEGTETLRDGQANLGGHTHGGGSPGINTTETHNSGTGFGTGGWNA